MRRWYAGVSSGPRTEECSASMMLSELKYDADRRYSDVFCLQDITYCIRILCKKVQEERPPIAQGPYQMHGPVKASMCVADVGESGPIGEGRTPQKAT